MLLVLQTLILLDNFTEGALSVWPNIPDLQLNRLIWDFFVTWRQLALLIVVWVGFSFFDNGVQGHPFTKINLLLPPFLSHHRKHRCQVYTDLPRKVRLVRLPTIIIYFSDCVFFRVIKQELSRGFNLFRWCLTHIKLFCAQTATHHLCRKWLSMRSLRRGIAWRVLYRTSQIAYAVLLAQKPWRSNHGPFSDVLRRITDRLNFIWQESAISGR